VSEENSVTVPTSLKVDGGGYPIETKIKVVQKYLVLGNMRLVSELTGISYDTLVEWRKTKWWLDLTEEIKRGAEASTNNKVAAILDQSLDEVKDRLVNGDWIFNQKTGELQRKPVSVRDAARIAVDLRNQQIKLNELEARITHENESFDSSLRTLAKEFAKWAKKGSGGEVIDVESKEIKE